MRFFSPRMRRTDRTAEYVGGSGSSAMISATVASARRWRMSMTCRSRRESALDSVLSVMAGRVRRGADFSTVLIIQQCGSKVKSQLLLSQRTQKSAGFATQKRADTAEKQIVLFVAVT